MTRTVRNLLLLFFTITALNNSWANTKLRFIGDVNFKTGEKFEGTEIGGLSGITYDKNQKKLLAISDDKGLINETRFYEFSVELSAKSFMVKPVAVIKLKNKDGEFFKKGYADFEGISLVGKDILISSEGNTVRAPTAPTEFYKFSRAGEFIELLPVPEKFLSGGRDNKTFESLSTTLDSETTFLGSEEALTQDGDVTSVNYSSHVRIIRYKNLKPVSEVAYKLEKVEAQKQTEPTVGDNGLVDIAAIDEKTFYSMERSYLPTANKNVIRIFKCTIKDKTTDVSKIESLKNSTFTSVEKELVASLEDFKPLMNPQELDNIEGLSFGPILPNGNRSLMVVSDNNFNVGQRTLFMAFEVLNKK